MSSTTSIDKTSSDIGSSTSPYACLTDIGLFSCGDADDNSKYTWEELNKIEQRRRAILKRVESPFWRILGYWDGTCLKVLIADGLLWISLAVYIAVRLACIRGEQNDDEDEPEYLSSLDDSSNIDIIGGFLSFFLVLFVNQANTRFNTMYRKSMNVTSLIEDVTSVVTCYFNKTSANRLVRYLNGAHAAGYVGMASDTYTTRQFFMKLDAQHKFFTKSEFERLQEIGLEDGPSAMNEILMWGIKEVQIAQDAKIIDARMSGEIRVSIQKIRNNMMELYQDKDQPIHFFYIHFLCLLTAFYLPLFAVATAHGVASNDEINWISEILSGLIMLLQAIFVIGLRLLGQVMVDPYGDDLEDLSVIHYIQETWLASNRILATKFPASLNEMVEDDIVKSRPATLGKAWEVDGKDSKSTSTSATKAGELA